MINRRHTLLKPPWHRSIIRLILSCAMFLAILFGLAFTCGTLIGVAFALSGLEQNKTLMTVVGMVVFITAEMVIGVPLTLRIAKRLGWFTPNKRKDT